MKVSLYLVLPEWAVNTWLLASSNEQRIANCYFRESVEFLDSSTILVGKATIELPDGIPSHPDIALRQIKILEDKIQTVQAEAQKEVINFRSQISKLQALTYETPKGE